MVAISIGFASRRSALGLIPTVLGDAWHLLTVEVEHPASGASAAFSHDGWIDLVQPRVRLTPFVEERGGAGGGAGAPGSPAAAKPAAPAPVRTTSASPPPASPPAAAAAPLPMTALLKAVGAPSPTGSGGLPGFGSVQALQALAQQRSPGGGAAVESAPPPPPAQLPAAGIGRTMPSPQPPPADAAAPRKSFGKRLLGLLSPRRGQSPSAAGK